jgi:hypothetical protein
MHRLAERHRGLGYGGGDVDGRGSIHGFLGLGERQNDDELQMTGMSSDEANGLRLVKNQSFFAWNFTWQWLWNEKYHLQ